MTTKSLVIDRYNRSIPVAEAFIEFHHPELIDNFKIVANLLSKKLNRLKEESYNVLLVPDKPQLSPIEAIESFANILIELTLIHREEQTIILSANKTNKCLRFNTKDGDYKTFRLNK